MKKNRPILGISAGDPAGIGPEITAKALSEREIYRQCRPLAVCDMKVMEEAIRFSGLRLRVKAIRKPEEGSYEIGIIDVLDMQNVEMSKLEYKSVSEMTGKAALLDFGISAQLRFFISFFFHQKN